MSHVVSSVVGYDSGSIGRKVVYDIKIQDNLQVEHDFSIGPVFVGESFDAQAGAIREGVNLLQDMKDSEAQGAPDAVYAGMNPLTMTESPQWGISKSIRKKLIRFLMHVPDPRFVLLMLPLTADLTSRFNNEELSGMLDLSLPQVRRLKRRIRAVTTSVGTMNQCLIEFDLEKEEID